MIIENLDIDFLINSILITSSFYLFFITLRDFFIKGYQNLSQNLAHFGFSLLILSILFNNIFSTEVITNLKVGQTFKSENLVIDFQSVDKKSEKNFQAIVGKFEIKELDNKSVILNPELRVYNQPNIVTSEADIKTNLLKDRFITMNLVSNQDYFNIRYQDKPFMIWIWLSVLLISSAGLLSLFKKKYEN
jgi:cytochrome c-type biogenesis protein CcmF